MNLFHLLKQNLINDICISLIASVPSNVWLSGERTQSIWRWRTGDVISDQLEWSTEYQESDASANHIHLTQSDEFKLSSQNKELDSIPLCEYVCK